MRLFECFHIMFLREEIAILSGSQQCLIGAGLEKEGVECCWAVGWDAVGMWHFCRCLVGVCFCSHISWAMWSLASSCAGLMVWSCGLPLFLCLSPASGSPVPTAGTWGVGTGSGCSEGLACRCARRMPRWLLSPASPRQKALPAPCQKTALLMGFQGF